MMALFLGSSQKGTFSGAALSLGPVIFFQRVGCFLQEIYLWESPRERCTFASDRSLFLRDSDSAKRVPRLRGTPQRII